MSQNELDLYGSAPGIEVPDNLMRQPTPVQSLWHGEADITVKRDDLFTAYGAPGGKARTCLAIIAEGGHPGGVVVTASSRHSPQAIIVAMIADGLGLRSRIHMPSGADTEEMELARSYGAEIVQHKPGYNSVIVHRARADAARDPKAVEVPFGMECWEAVRQTARSYAQTRAAGASRIVVPVGSGMSLAGILQGMDAVDDGRPVLGVRVGANPELRLNEYGPFGWKNRVELVQAPVPYETGVKAKLGNVLLDPIYEAKCLPYLQPGDLFWIVGIRANLTTRPKEVNDETEVPRKGARRRVRISGAGGGGRL